MAKALAAMLGKSEASLARAIQKLEAAAGAPSEDLRLLAESKAAVRQKIKDLGLDPEDTTGPELYHALLTRFGRDSQLLHKTLGIQADSSYAEKVQKAAAIVKRAMADKELWSLRLPATKALLKEHPPRRLMKHFGYRTIDSMLKREAVEGLTLITALTESPTWQTELRRAIKKLDSSKFRLASASLVYLEPAKFEVFAGGQNVLTSQLSAAVGLAPNHNNEQADVLTLALRFKTGLESLGLKLDERRLHSVHPALAWWSGSSHLMHHHKGEAVNFNLADVADNFSNNTSYDQRQSQSGQQSLWDELVSRYHAYSQDPPAVAPEVEAELGNAIEAKEPLVPMQLATETVEA